MIKVVIHGKNDKVTISGHALYNDYGKDIVCAGVSSVVITTINAILTFNKEYINYSINNDNVSIEVIEHNNIVDNLISNMIDMLEDIASDYPKNINLRKEN